MALEENIGCRCDSASDGHLGPVRLDDTTKRHDTKMAVSVRMIVLMAEAPYRKNISGAVPMRCEFCDGSVSCRKNMMSMRLARTTSIW
jgi:hypothetical protein